MPEKIDFNVIDETNDYIIVEKSPNLIMHPGVEMSKESVNGLLLDFLSYKIAQMWNRTGLIKILLDY